MKFKVLATDKKNGINSCKYIMLHHTAMGRDIDGKSAARYLSGPKTQGGMVSCHYVIGQNGTKWKIGLDTDRLWHAGNGYYNGITDGNSNFIGIEIDSDGYTFSNKQIESTNELVLLLMKMYNIPAENIITHKQYDEQGTNPTGKWDVGPNFFEIQDLKDILDYRVFINNLLIMNNYKDIFIKEFGTTTLLKDIEGAIKDCTTPEQTVYLMLIIAERLRKEIQK